GLEIIVTKAQISKGGTPVDSIEDVDESVDITIDEKAKNILDEKFGKSNEEEASEEETTNEDETLWMTAQYADLEDVIQLSHYLQNNYETEQSTEITYYKENYSFYVMISPQLY